MSRTELPIVYFDDNVNFWLIRAEGGKIFDDFINNDYIGIRYNKVKVSDLKKIEELATLDGVKNVVFEKYKNSKKLKSINNLSSEEKAKLTTHSKQIFSFMFDMKENDIVLVPSKRSENFALGIIVSDPYDEVQIKINKQIDDFNNGSISYRPSKFIKRRMVQWISIISRNDIPSEIAWVLNAHQALAKLECSDPTQLMNLVWPIFKYKKKYYLRIHTSKGDELTTKNWADFTNSVKEENAVLHATINSPGFFTFLTITSQDLIKIIKTLFGPTSVSIPTIVALKQVTYLLFGKEAIKKYGILKVIGDRYREHKDNKVYNLKKEKEYEALKNNKEKTQAQKMGLSIEQVGKPIEKESKIIKLDTDKKANDK